MPLKRKAPPAPSAPEHSPPRRRLRSNAQLPSSTYDALPIIRRGPPKKPVPVKAKTTRKADIAPSHTSETYNASSKLQTTAGTSTGSDDSDTDELLLSPSKSRSRIQQTPPRTAAPRMIMHSVEIAAPRQYHTRTRLAPSSPRQSSLSMQRKTTSEERADAPPAIFPAPLPLQVLTNGTVTPSRRQRPLPSPVSPIRPTDSTLLPYNQCLHAQKSATLTALRNPSADVDELTQEGTQTNAEALQQLRDLLHGTIDRGEGNSCLLIGPRGSGKSRVIDEALNSFAPPPIVIRLSGHVQHNDRLAMREIARQIAKQTGRAISTDDDLDVDQEENPFLDVDSSTALPPASHLPTLISALPTFSRPTVVILDAVDLFALHGRQALLYCLLDTAQSCRASQDTKGIAVVGETARIDTINLLEKRVKSRFSGRTIRTAAPQSPLDWMALARRTLCTPIKTDDADWTRSWSGAIEQFLSDRTVVDALEETFGLTRDVRKLCQILTDLTISLSPEKPFPTAELLIAAISSQRAPHPFPILASLSYPSVCLLIAAVHAGTAGHEAMTFEMLHDAFRLQLRTSLSAPVQVEGAGIGMMKCSREVLMTAFEQLIAARVFTLVASTSSNTRSEFLKYKFMVERDDVKKAVEASGQTNLKKWFSKAQ